MEISPVDEIFLKDVLQWLNRHGEEVLTFYEDELVNFIILPTIVEEILPTKEDWERFRKLYIEFANKNKQENPEIRRIEY